MLNGFRNCVLSSACVPKPHGAPPHIAVADHNRRRGCDTHTITLVKGSSFIAGRHACTKFRDIHSRRCRSAGSGNARNSPTQHVILKCKIRFFVRRNMCRACAQETLRPLSSGGAIGARSEDTAPDTNLTASGVGRNVQGPGEYCTAVLGALRPKKVKLLWNKLLH